MVWITASAERSVRVRAPKDAVWQLIKDVETSGRFWPGVRSITAMGDATYRWELEPRRTLGVEFRPEYVSRYRDNGRDEVRYETVSGNVRSTGCWKVSERGREVEVGLEITSEVDAPVPGLLKKPAELFARREVQSGIEAQLDAFKRHVEKSAPRS